MKPRPHIVIIGAGIAGLTAAIKIGEGADAMIASGRLKTRPDITILESDNILGGRARTEILSNGITVDAGPHWFHGGEGNAFYKWATGRRYKLGPVSLDTAKHRVNLASEHSMSADQREWGLTRLFEMYSVWKSQHPDKDIALGTLARMSGSDIILKIADERASNWMALPSADDVSSEEYWGDDTGSGGMQLEQGMQILIEAMAQDARFYQADIHTRSAVHGVFTKAGKPIRVVTAKHDYEADIVINTASIGVLKSGVIKFDPYVQSQLDPILAGMTAAKMTKIFIPLRPKFFTERNIAPDTFLTFYDSRHSWLFHLHTDGKPTITVFASGNMSELVERERPATLERELFEMFDRIPLLAGASDHLDGRVMRTDWSTNENFLCAYSAMLPGHKRRNPLISNNMIFAGEAWVENMKKSPTQMSGAFTSGSIAAKKTLQKLTLNV